jgi:chemotaxis protein methyltransferase CheR
MRREDFQFLAELLKRASGLSLTSERAELIETRLAPVMERHGFAGVSDLVRELRHRNESLTRAVVEAITTRDTSFFRDRAAFDSFEDALLPWLLRTRLPKRRISIWSAACSTGQEPYSIAMIFARLPQFAGWQVDILATDVSADAIRCAKDGVYTEAEVQRGLPSQMLADHFRAEGAQWRISSSIRSQVEFRVLNLLDSFSALGPFDVILCRNVLMYFDSDTKADVLDRLSGTLAHDGYLVLGAAETMLGLNNSFAFAGPLRGIKTKSGGAQRIRAAAIE